MLTLITYIETLLYPLGSNKNTEQLLIRIIRNPASNVLLRALKLLLLSYIFYMKNLNALSLENITTLSYYLIIKCTSCRLIALI